MSDLIDRKALLDHLDLCLTESDGKTPITDAVIVAIKCAVEQMPAVDAEPVRHGTGKDSRTTDIAERTNMENLFGEKE